MTRLDSGPVVRARRAALDAFRHRVYTARDSTPHECDTASKILGALDVDIGVLEYEQPEADMATLDQITRRVEQTFTQLIDLQVAFNLRRAMEMGAVIQPWEAETLRAQLLGSTLMIARPMLRLGALIALETVYGLKGDEEPESTGPQIQEQEIKRRIRQILEVPEGQSSTAVGTAIAEKLEGTAQDEGGQVAPEPLVKLR